MSADTGKAALVRSVHEFLHGSASPLCSLDCIYLSQAERLTDSFTAVVEKQVLAARDEGARSIVRQIQQAMPTLYARLGQPSLNDMQTFLKTLDEGLAPAPPAQGDQT